MVYLCQINWEAHLAQSGMSLWRRDFTIHDQRCLMKLCVALGIAPTSETMGLLVSSLVILLNRQLA